MHIELGLHRAHFKGRGCFLHFRGVQVRAVVIEDLPSVCAPYGPLAALDRDLDLSISVGISRSVDLCPARLPRIVSYPFTIRRRSRVGGRPQLGKFIDGGLVPLLANGNKFHVLGMVAVIAGVSKKTSILGYL